MIQATKHTPFGEGPRLYNTILLENSLPSLLETKHELAHLLHRTLLFPDSALLLAQAPYLKRSMTRLRGVSTILASLQDVLCDFRLRKHESNKRRVVFIAFQHSFYSKFAMLYKLIDEIRRYIFKNWRGCGWDTDPKDKARYSLGRMNSALGRLKQSYVRDYIPVYMRRLDLMFASELDRNVVRAKRYWFTYWQAQRQNDQRLAKLEADQIRNREAWDKFQKERRRRSLKAKSHGMMKASRS